MQAPATPAGHWFDGRSLARLTDPGTWERGFALYVSQHVLALQERKAALADSMYSGAAARKQPLFTENDLAQLLQPLSGA